MQYAFQAYMRDAWKADEYLPVKRRGLNTFGGKGLTIIDSLDTLYLMGLETEFKSAREFVKSEFKFDGRTILNRDRARHQMWIESVARHWTIFISGLDLVAQIVETLTKLCKQLLALFVLVIKTQVREVRE